MDGDKRGSKKMKSEYEHVMSMSNELGQHLGQWIAVVGDKVVASGDSFKDVYAKAKKDHPDKDPFIMKIPKETVMLM